MSAIFAILLFLTALFLILLVLVQRGRGGGLSGALGGMGGQSAFGTKAGDLFTRVTIVVATVWLSLCVLAIVVLNRQSTTALGNSGEGADYRRGAAVGENEPGKSGAASADKGAGAGSATTPPATTPPATTPPATTPEAPK
jgi:preprotein translocase subunit SecG